MLLFSHRDVSNIENEKIVVCLKITEIDEGDQFWVEKNNSGHRNSFFSVEPIFRGQIAEFDDSFSS